MSSTPSPTQLPAQAQRRIDRLEEAVIELAGTLEVVVRKVSSAGVKLDLKLPKGPLGYAILKKLGPERLRALADQAEAARPPQWPAKRPAAPSKTTPHAHPNAELGGLAGATARGEVAKVEWVRSGEVVPAKTLAQAWNLTPQALGPAARRGEVFAVVVKGQRHYPREFLLLSRDDVAAVCKPLQGLTPSEQLVFWKRKHGALGGRTLLEALTAANNGPALARAVQLAQSRTAQMRADAAQAA